MTNLISFHQPSRRFIASRNLAAHPVQDTLARQQKLIKTTSIEWLKTLYECKEWQKRNKKINNLLKFKRQKIDIFQQPPYLFTFQAIPNVSAFWGTLRKKNIRQTTWWTIKLLV